MTPLQLGPSHYTQYLSYDKRTNHYFVAHIHVNNLKELGLFQRYVKTALPTSQKTVSDAGEIITVYSENNIKHLHTLYVRNAEFMKF